MERLQMLDLSTIIQIVSNPTALIAIIISIISFFISIGSFYYGRKPLLQIKPLLHEGKIINYEFIIKNVSEYPAKNNHVKIKLSSNENIQGIGEYELPHLYEVPYLNPEEEDVIKGIFEEIESKLENEKLIIKVEYKWPKKLDPFFETQIFFDKIRLIYSEYLFSWNDVPGADNGRLIEFLKQKFDINWVKTANIEKIDDDRTIRLTDEKKSLSLELNDAKTEVSSKINDVRSSRFIAELENDKLKIYESYFKRDELKTLYSHKINRNFKIFVTFEINCNSDILFEFPLLNKHKFLYRFEISYTELDKDYMDFLKDEQDEAYYEFSYGYRDNFKLVIQPSKGKWK